MKLANIFTIALLAIVPYAIGAELNKESVYQFESSWRNQNNQEIVLADLQGEIRLVAFVYTYCEHTCPLIIAQIKSILEQLPNKPRKLLQVTLVTLDPKRDTPPQMKSYMEKHQLNENQWTMLAGNPSDVRVLSNLFDVKYKAMSKNELAHSNMITLVDREGVIQYQLKGLNVNKSEIIALISKL